MRSVASSHSASDSSSFRQYYLPSIGARIPPELFERVIYFVLGGSCEHFADERIDTYDYDLDSDRNFSRKELANCTLVSRFWARHVRPSVFWKLKLRLREDAETFIAFARCEIWPEHMRIAEYVSSLELHQSTRSLPWFYHITHCMPRDFLGRSPPTTSSFQLHLHWSLGPSANESALCSSASIFDGLPRSLPSPTAFATRDCYATRVEHLTFPRLQDLLTFASSAFRWRHSHRYHSLRWQDHGSIEPAWLPAKPVTTVRAQSFTLTTLNCDATWPFAWLCTTTTAPNPAARMNQLPIYVLPEDLQNIMALAKQMVDDCHCVWCQKHTSRPPGPGIYSQYGAISVRSFTQTTNSTLSIGGPHTVAFEISRGGQVAALTLRPFDSSRRGTYDLQAQPPAALALDWDAVDRLAVRFAAAVVTFEVPTRSDDVMRVFAPFVRASMRRVQEQGRLAVVYGKSFRIQRYAWRAWNPELEEHTGAEVGAQKTQCISTDLAA